MGSSNLGARVYDVTLALALIATFFLCDNTVAKTQSNVQGSKIALIASTK
jgi:hypothetical protein